MKSQREPLVSYGSVKTAALKKGDSHPKNYAVPNFGVDTDILDSQRNLHNTEINLGHDLNLKVGGSRNTGVDDFDGHPMNYKVPDFGMDRDILDSLSNLKSTEAKLGKWKY
jgi:hypothetical protein